MYGPRFPLPLLLLATLTLLAPSCRGRAAPKRAVDVKRGVAAAAPPAYDVRPLLRALRPGVAEEVQKQLGLTDLTDLPYYDLDLALDEGNARLSGKLVLYYLNRTGRPIAALPLLLHPNAPLELGASPGAAALEVTSARALEGPAVRLAKKRPTLVELAFARPLLLGERVKIELHFAGSLRKLPPGSNDVLSQALSSLGVSGAGAASSDYGLLAEGDGILTAASAYPMVAPFRRGRFDGGPPSKFGDLSYNELANYRVRVTAPSGTAVVTNLLDLAERTTTPSGAGVHTAVGAANRDLVVVAGRTLRRATRTAGGVRVTSVFAEGDAPAGQRILATAAGSLALFERLYGPYPFVELDVAEATLVGGAGGVEFPGMILVAGMLYRPPSQSASPLATLLKLTTGLGSLLGGLDGAGAIGGLGGGKAAPGLREMDAVMQDLALFTTAHEVAHQFFAGLVGTDCRLDPAVDEPLAQFAAGEYARRERGPEAGQRLMDQNVKLNYAIYRLLGGKDAPAARPVRDFASPLSYAALVYGKAPYFYPALRKRIGAEAFDRALRAAVDANRFKLIDLSEWIASLERAAGHEGRAAVRPLARRWLFETKGDQDLGVDEEGDAVLDELLGKEVHGQLKEGLGLLGMKPRDLLRSLLGGLL